MAKNKPTWNGYQNSGFSTASGVAGLQNQMGNYSLDQAVLNQQAEAQYKPTYNANVLALNQELEKLLGGYNNQLSGLSLTYDQQRRATNSQYDQSGSAALSQLGKRGMGRSSIVGTTLGALEGARNQALGDIGAKEGDAYGDIYANMALAQNQNAASLRGLSDNYAGQVEARAKELYTTNAAAQAQLAYQIAQLQQAGYQYYVNQVNKKNGSKSSGGHSSGGGSGGNSSPTTSNGNASTLAGNSGGMSQTDPYHSSNYFR